MSVAKSATKTVDKTLKALGATRRTVAHGVEYTFPDGMVKLVLSNVTWRTADLIMRDMKARYYRPAGRPALSGVKIPAREVPAFDIASACVTEHAVARRRLMCDQAGMTPEEVLFALRIPHWVEWNERHGTYTWVGERIGVVGHVRDGVLTIRTFLWTTDELWELNPRTEKEKA